MDLTDKIYTTEAVVFDLAARLNGCERRVEDIELWRGGRITELAKERPDLVDLGSERSAVENALAGAARALVQYLKQADIQTLDEDDFAHRVRELYRTALGEVSL